jgi:hypothetical protein
MLEKLEAIKRRFEDVEVELSSPTAMSDMKRFAQLNKEYKELSKIVAEYLIYSNIMSNIESNKEILATEKDEEFREMAKAELDTLIHERDKMEEDIRLMLIPSDPEDIQKVRDWSSFSTKRLATVKLPGFLQPVPAISVFYALGLTNDQDIYDTVLHGVRQSDKKAYDELFLTLILSHEKYLQQELLKESDQTMQNVLITVITQKLRVMQLKQFVQQPIKKKLNLSYLM